MMLPMLPIVVVFPNARYYISRDEHSSLNEVENIKMIIIANGP